MSIIEQAAMRLQQLQRAGVTIEPATALAGAGVAVPNTEVTPMPSLAERAVAQAGADITLRVAEVPPATLQPPTRAAETRPVLPLDAARLARHGLIVPEQTQTPLAQEFRAIKRPLLANARGQGAGPVARGHCIMVTSSVPGEGKTFTAVNLALSLALGVDTRVLLVDADVLNPSVHDRLGLPLAPGLLDLLTQRSQRLDEVIQRTSLDALEVMTAGSAKAPPAELLATESMRRVIDTLATRYADRIVVFDTPPLLATSETALLARALGQVVVVVQAQRTSQPTLDEALSTLDDCPVVMTLLNQARTGGGSYYGYAA